MSFPDSKPVHKHSQPKGNFEMVISSEETKQPDIIFTNIFTVVADPYLNGATFSKLNHYTSMSESSSELPYAEKTDKYSPLY